MQCDVFVLGYFIFICSTGRPYIIKTRLAITHIHFYVTETYLFLFLINHCGLSTYNKDDDDDDDDDDRDDGDDEDDVQKKTKKTSEV